MDAIGVMAMPPDFPYRDVFLKGKPRHDRLDAFRIRHPSMSAGQRAKIFSPFDALRGFGEAVGAKDVRYVDRIVPGEEDRAETDRRLRILRGLTWNAWMAKANRVRVSVTFYEPCADVNSDAYGFRGRYRTVTGICRKVDPEVFRTIQVDGETIALEDVLSVESEDGIFAKYEPRDFPDG